MKKTLLALSIVLSFISCSNNNDDDNTTINNQQPATTQYFHPPTWIQGTWGVTNGTITNKLFKFTNDDFIMLISGGSEQSMTGTIKLTPNGGSVDETINNETQYNFIIKYNSSSVTQNYEFKKISPTLIQWKDVSGNWNFVQKL